MKSKKISLLNKDHYVHDDEAPALMEGGGLNYAINRTSERRGSF